MIEPYLLNQSLTLIQSVLDGGVFMMLLLRMSAGNQRNQWPNWTEEEKLVPSGESAERKQIMQSKYDVKVSALNK